jgi:tetratricopeptide (TPR) repeat protein
MKLKPLFLVIVLMLFVNGVCFSQEETAEFYYNRGRENFENCYYHRAMEDYNHALQLKPGYAEALNGRGEIYLNVSEYTDAEREFAAAIAINPKYEKAYINRGRLYKTIGRYDMAIADLAKALELNPGLPELEEELAALYLCRGTGKSEIRDITGAIKDLTLACLHDPENAESWYRLGVLFLYLGDIANAQSCFLEVHNILGKQQNPESFFALLEKSKSFFIHTMYTEDNYVC